MIEKFLVILIILLPLQFALNIGENFDLVTTRILIPVIFLFWIARSLARREIWIPNRAEMWLVISFLFLSTLSLVLGRDANAGVRKLIFLLSIFPVFFVAADIFREEKWRQRGVIAVMVSGSVAAVIALAQFSLPYFVGVAKAVRVWEGFAPYFLGKSFGELVAANSSWLVNIGGETRMRAFGFFPDPHNFAFFANLCLFSGLGYFSCKNGKYSSKFLISAGVAAVFGAVILSFSRGAYLGLIAGLLFFAVIYLKRAEILGKAAIITCLVLVIAFSFNSKVISQRFMSSFNLKEGSNAERYKNWAQAAQTIRDYPLGGVGLGNYARSVDPRAGERSSIYAHNLFLDIAAETGVLNVVVFLLLIFFSVRRNVLIGDMPGLGIAAGLVGFSVHSIFDTALWSPQVMTLLLVIIALGLNDNLKFKNKNSK